MLGVPTPFARWHPLRDVVAIHGLHRQREWDAITTVRAPDAPGDGFRFVTLPDGTVLQEDGPDADLTRFADAADAASTRPYRALAVRREGDVWAIGILAIDVVELPGLVGEELELVVHEGRRTLRVDGRPEFAEPEPLAAVARDAEDVGVRGERLDGDLWEIGIAAL